MNLLRSRWTAVVLAAGCFGAGLAQGTAKPARPVDAVKVPTKDDLLRGAYGPYRANNDLLFYALKLRVDPEKKTIAGTNVVRFRMLADGQRIQLELTPELTLDAITLEGDGPVEVGHGVPLHYTREERTLWIDFPQMLHQGATYSVKVAYHGQPVTQGRFGCFSFDKDKEGKPWITTACEEEGPSVWWPNKDQWRDEPQEGMEIDVAVPNGLMDVSNGRFVGSKDLGDGYTEWQWRVHYPINNYDVALNIGEYQHWSGVHVNKEVAAARETQIPFGNDKQKGKQETQIPFGNDKQKGKGEGGVAEGVTTLDFYALPEDLEKAKVQFAQVPEMMDAYEHYFGEYPFDEDGYKLIEVPYAGMEHQSAVAYGNHFENGYYGRDWTGVGISPKFDFIIIHESGHEWFGNAVSAADVSDMWIHEGWTTYMEGLYVEYRWGKADAIKYLNGLKPKVSNERPIVTARGVNSEPPQDQYFKGALMLNTLRSVVGDDAKWFADIHDFYQAFKYRNSMTEDVVAWWSARTGMELRPFFDEYLRHAALPVLELHFSNSKPIVYYRWRADEPGFAMPIKVKVGSRWTTLTPTKDWQEETWGLEDGQDTSEKLIVPTDLYYVNVDRNPNLESLWQRLQH
jgi:aminopeptidase N